MSKLISGKEALMALANGEEVQYANATFTKWSNVSRECRIRMFDDADVYFHLKPRTITINGIEVPSPFEPKVGDDYYHLWPRREEGFAVETFDIGDNNDAQFGAWRTEEEIKQVVAALRKVFEVQP